MCRGKYNQTRSPTQNNLKKNLSKRKNNSMQRNKKVETKNSLNLLGAHQAPKHQNYLHDKQKVLV